nr:hypothetical protein [Candidatus Gracilibacteria bacterium]
NLPDSYKNLGYSMTGGFDFIPNKLVVYSGSTQDLLQDSNKLILINNIKQAYINTIVQGEPTYKEIINTDTTSNQAGAITLVNNYLTSGVGGLPKVTQEQINNITQLNSCATQPIYTNATFTVGTPTQINQAWQNTNNANPCYYTCINGYTGADCSTPPPSFLALCTTNGQIIYEDANGLELGRVSNKGVTLSGNPGLLTCAGHIAICSSNGVGYVLQACNLGSSVVGTTTSSYGKYYQWGRNKGFVNGSITQQPTTITGSIGLDASTDTYGFVWNSSLPAPQTWASTTIDNNWGGNGTTTLYTYWDLGASNKSLMRGPCSSGYHVPTSKEWTSIVLAGGWDTLGNTKGYNLRDSLKMPVSGRISVFNGALYDEGYGFYCSSSPGGVYEYNLYFSFDTITAGGTNSRALGFNIRCFKN